MPKKNTGNFRLCKHQIGIGGTIEILSNNNSKSKTIKAFNVIEKETNWDYYCEEEVVYKGTLLDENKNPVDSVPTWIRFSI